MTKRKRNVLIAIGASVILLIILVVVIGHFFVAPALYMKKIEFGYRDIINGANQYAEDVTMVQLIANPERYHGKLVRVKGVGNLEFEGDCLSLSKEDRGDHNIWLEFGGRSISYADAQRYNGEWVLVEGFFDKDDHGHLSAYVGAIKNINRYESWERHAWINPELFDTTLDSYVVKDKNGNVIGSAEGLPCAPSRQSVTDSMAGIYMREEKDSPVRKGIFYNIETGEASETFDYCLVGQGDYVIYVVKEDGQHKIAVQNIFDKSKFYETYEMESVADVDKPVIEYAIVSEGIVLVTYLQGEQQTHAEMLVRTPVDH